MPRRPAPRHPRAGRSGPYSRVTRRGPPRRTALAPRVPCRTRHPSPRSEPSPPVAAPAPETGSVTRPASHQDALRKPAPRRTGKLPCSRTDGQPSWRRRTGPSGDRRATETKPRKRRGGAQTGTTDRRPRPGPGGSPAGAFGGRPRRTAAGPARTAAGSPQGEDTRAGATGGRTETARQSAAPRRGPETEPRPGSCGAVPRHAGTGAPAGLTRGLAVGAPAPTTGTGRPSRRTRNHRNIRSTGAAAYERASATRRGTHRTPETEHRHRTGPEDDATKKPPPARQRHHAPARRRRGLPQGMAPQSRRGRVRAGSAPAWWASSSG